MAWLSRVNFVSSDTLSFTDVNNLGNDIRAWGDNVNGGGYTLSNVAVSASTILIGGASGSNPSAKLDVQSTNVRFYSGSATTDSRLDVGNADVSGGQGGFLIFHASAATPYLSLNALSQGVAWRNIAMASSGGNVGIGTASPSWQATVYGAGQNTALLTDAGSKSASLFVGSSNGTAGAGGAVLLGGIVANGVTSQWAIKSIMTSTTANGTGDLAFVARAAAGDTSLTERMRITSGGNVAIGSSAAARKLTVYEGTAATSDVGVRVEHVSNKPAYMEFVTTQRTANFGLGNFSGAGFTGSMQLVCDGGFNICPNGTGNVSIGMVNPAYQLQLSTDSAAKPSTNTWTIASDERLKTVLGDYEKGLDAICALRPVRYEYNGLGGMPADGKEHISIVAQQAQEVFPECIGTFQGKLHEDDEEETELLNYNGHAVTFALINAVRELKARLDALA